MSDATPKLEIIDFFAEWCGPCHVMKPIIEELAKDYEGKVTFNKIDVDQNQELAQEYNVLSIPTMVFKKDGVVADQVIGAIPKDQLKHKIDHLLE